MSDAYAFLIWLVCIGISALLIGYFIRQLGTDGHSKEGFVIHVCPTGSIQYINRDGETLCCNGDIVDGRCTGNDVCSLSPKNRRGLMSCTYLAEQDAIASGSAQCPPAMPNYFASLDGSLKGCSISQTTPDGTAPSDPNKVQCILYPTAALDQIKLDSCYNYLKTAAALASANSPACRSAQAAADAKQYAANAAAQAAQAAADSAKAQANAQAGGIGTLASSMASLMASPKASMASLMALSKASVASPVASPVAAPVKPMGYVIYGEGISGNLAVTKIVDAFNPGNPAPAGKIYLAQDGSVIRKVDVDTTYTKNYGSSYFTGNLSEINSFGDLNRISGNAPGGNNQANYSIKKADGTGILTR